MHGENSGGVVAERLHAWLLREIQFSPQLDGGSDHHSHQQRPFTPASLEKICRGPMANIWLTVATRLKPRRQVEQFQRETGHIVPASTNHRQAVRRQQHARAAADLDADHERVRQLQADISAAVSQVSAIREETAAVERDTLLKLAYARNRRRFMSEQTEYTARLTAQIDRHRQQERRQNTNNDQYGNQGLLSTPLAVQLQLATQRIAAGDDGGTDSGDSFTSPVEALHTLADMSTLRTQQLQQMELVVDNDHSPSADEFMADLYSEFLDNADGNHQSQADTITAKQALNDRIQRCEQRRARFLDSVDHLQALIHRRVKCRQQILLAVNECTALAEEKLAPLCGNELKSVQELLKQTANTAELDAFNSRNIANARMTPNRQTFSSLAVVQAQHKNSTVSQLARHIGHERPEDAISACVRLLHHTKDNSKYAEYTEALRKETEADLSNAVELCTGLLPRDQHDGAAGASLEESVDAVTEKYFRCAAQEMAKHRAHILAKIDQVHAVDGLCEDIDSISRERREIADLKARVQH